MNWIELQQFLQQTGGTFSLFYWAGDNTWRATFIGRQTFKIRQQPSADMAIARLVDTIKEAGLL